MADLHRTNLHLHTSDVIFLVNHFGYGWTGHVRDLVRREVNRIRDLRGLPRIQPQPNAPVDLRPFDLDQLIQEQDQ